MPHRAVAQLKRGGDFRLALGKATEGLQLSDSISRRALFLKGLSSMNSQIWFLEGVWDLWRFGSVNAEIPNLPSFWEFPNLVASNLAVCNFYVEAFFCARLWRHCPLCAHLHVSASDHV